MNGTFTLTDGAWGTQLQALGLALGDCPDVWNLSHPELVKLVARSYVDAGSDVILTNTFRANAIALEPLGLREHVREINALGARISKEAAQGRARVFGSIGPAGKLLLTGEVTERDLEEAFREQAEALAPYVDGVVIETMSDVREAQLAIGAARGAGLTVAACLVFDSGRNKDRTMMGVTPEQGALALAEAGADIIGANCGNGIAGYVEICRRMQQAAAGLPVWIKANAGLPEMVGGQVVYRMTPQEFAAVVPDLLNAGATYVGGCCGTTPDFIREVRRQCG
jgi:methionine synthase I (cobalamin-dependent)